MKKLKFKCIGCTIQPCTLVVYSEGIGSSDVPLYCPMTGVPTDKYRYEEEPDTDEMLIEHHIKSINARLSDVEGELKRFWETFKAHQHGGKT